MGRGFTLRDLVSMSVSDRLRIRQPLCEHLRVFESLSESTLSLAVTRDCRQIEYCPLSLLLLTVEEWENKA